MTKQVEAWTVYLSCAFTRKNHIFTIPFICAPLLLPRLQGLSTLRTWRLATNTWTREPESGAITSARPTTAFCAEAWRAPTSKCASTQVLERRNSTTHVTSRGMAAYHVTWRSATHFRQRRAQLTALKSLFDSFDVDVVETDLVIFLFHSQIDFAVFPHVYSASPWLCVRSTLNFYYMIVFCVLLLKTNRNTWSIYM